MTNMITHIGSINVDYVVHNQRLPRIGETVFGQTIDVACGGKGAIQIAAAARLGARTCFLSMVGGSDSNLQVIRNDLAWAGVDTSRVGEVPNGLCGYAFVLIDEQGQNSIIIVPGADRFITPDYIDKNQDCVKNCKVCMTEFMVPMVTCEYAISMAHRNGAITIVNPAPVQAIDNHFYKFIDVLTPNEMEAADYCGFGIEDEASAQEACQIFHAKGVKNVIITLGQRGVFVSDGKNMTIIDAYPVKAIDTAGAGDSFNGGLAYALWRGKDIITAARFGNATASVAVQRKGSYRSIPNLNDVESIYKL